jgi:hypothetical protein
MGLACRFRHAGVPELQDLERVGRVAEGYGPAAVGAGLEAIAGQSSVGQPYSCAIARTISMASRLPLAPLVMTTAPWPDSG